MTVIHAGETSLGPRTRPEWSQTPSAGFFRMPKEGGEHDCHYHEFNELYLIARGRAKILNAGRHEYVRERDIICIKAGDEHDILEVYGDEDLELFWVYEAGPDGARAGHLHRSPERARGHLVRAKPIPPDFPG
jgi:mannose-6-phosphate isomerase-like protein (cupin superfamily)